MNQPEPNVTLALFMGMTKKYSYIHGGVVYQSGFSTYSEDELRYDSSYDWLIGVVKEITHKHTELSIEFQENIKQNPYDKKHLYLCCTRFVESL